MHAPSAKKPKPFCSHCSKTVSRSTWYRHYSDRSAGAWEREKSDSDFSFSSSEESDSNSLAQSDHGCINDAEFDPYSSDMVRLCHV